VRPAAPFILIFTYYEYIQDGSARVWDLRSQKSIRRIGKVFDNGSVNSVCFSPNVPPPPTRVLLATLQLPCHPHTVIDSRDFDSILSPISQDEHSLFCASECSLFGFDLRRPEILLHEVNDVPE